MESIPQNFSDKPILMITKPNKKGIFLFNSRQRKFNEIRDYSILFKKLVYIKRKYKI